MLLMFIPLILLWFLSVLLAAIIGRKKDKARELDQS
jgi:Sec-independent protein secretion pathway component TatC